MQDFKEKAKQFVDKPIDGIYRVLYHRFSNIGWTNKGKVSKFLTEQLPTQIKADKKVMDDITTSLYTKNARIFFDKKVEELMKQYLFSQTKIFKLFLQTNIFKYDTRILFLYN